MSERAGAEAGRQLPSPGEIYLDHVGHFVRDADAARRALARAGFTPTPLSVHVDPAAAADAPRPTGTGNVTAMLARGYIEVLFRTADTALGRELEAGLARYRGVHLAAFVVADAAAAHRRLGTLGFRLRPLAEMQRPVDTGAEPGTAAFTVARLEAGEMPEGRVQILTHRTEHMVWQPRWLEHANGARSLRSLTIAVSDVEEAAERFARFTGRTAVVAASGRTIALDRGRIELTTAEGFARMLPEVPIPSLPFMGAYTIRVVSLAALEEILRSAGVSTRRNAHRLVATFPEELGHGAWLFEE